MILEIILICVIAFVVGAVTGNHLAKRGITAENALEKYQKTAMLMIIGLALIFLIGWLFDQLNLANRVPLFLSLYLANYIQELILGIGTFSLGLLIFLELPGRSNSQRMIQLCLALILITIPLSILFHYNFPVTFLVGQPKVIDGIVLQTTDVTCAPATIATLARKLKINPNLSEKEVVELTGTNRFGTTALAEIRAMKKLGLQPEYERNLKIDHLIKRKQLALLHVKENINGQLIDHAVALLAINQQDQKVIIGNPLTGIEEKTFSEMETYWYGEAIFVK